MKLRIFAVLGLATAVLSACIATTKERYMEDGYYLLSGAEISELVSDRTVEGLYGSGAGSFVEYYAPDGRISTKEPSTQGYIGTWEVDGDLLCFTYPTGTGSFPKCVEMAVKKGHYVQFRTSGPAYGKLGAKLTKVTPGNVKNLPLE